MNHADLSTKTVLVTGSSKNLGAAIARKYAEKGAKNVVIHYHSSNSQAQAKALADELTAKHGTNTEVVSGDLSVSAEAKAIFSQAIKKFGSVDIAVNCVGAIVKKPVVDLTEADFALLDKVNNVGGFNFVQEAARQVSDGGKILSVITSLVGAFTPFYGAYAGSKASIEQYTRALAKELMGRGVSINCIAPGPIDTPFFHGQESPEAVAYLKSVALENRLGTVEDITPIVVFLTTEGRWINGQTIFANGGFVTR